MLTAPAALLIVVNFNLSDTPSALDNLSRSQPCAASSADTLAKNVHKYKGCRHLMESAVNNVDGLSWETSSVTKIEIDHDQERGQKKVVVEKSCQNKVCSIFDAN